MNKLTYLLTASCVGLAAGAMVVQSGGKTAKPSAAPVPAPSAALSGSAAGGGYASGMTVTIDPTTREIRAATPEEVQSLAAPQAMRLAAPTPRPEVVRLGNGMRMVRLPESFMETATVAKRADGTLAFNCGRTGQPDDAEHTAKPANVPTTTTHLEEQ
jgi:hypothetical protein